MAKPKTKLKEKEPSFERYARIIQNDIAALGREMRAGFGSLREEMATKYELGALRTELKNDIRDVGERVDRLNSVMVSKGELAEVIRREFDVSPYAKESELRELRDDLNRVFEKLGMKPPRRSI